MSVWVNVNSISYLEWSKKNGPYHHPFSTSVENKPLGKLASGNY